MEYQGIGGLIVQDREDLAIVDLPECVAAVTNFTS